MRPRNILRNFRKDEDGSIIVFTLFILVLMLIVGGMAVDFMRFESRRALMQGTVDRAVLAAADLDQVSDPAAVVVDYVTKADGPYCLTGEPEITNGANYRSVTANCEWVMPAHFLKLVGIESLTARATATAIEGVGNVEVSLVVDLTGSMGWNISGTTTPRIERLQEAATAFVDTLLVEDHKDKISISLVPYSSQVNLGEGLFNAVGVNRVHSYSNCVNFSNDAYGDVAWPNAHSFTQAQHFRKYSSWSPTCRNEDYVEIIPISQDRTAINQAISEFTASGSTSIFQGIKWGALLLDPSMEPLLDALPAAMKDPAFENRPFDYENTGINSTRKFIVVMTDGENVGTEELVPEVYDTPSEIAHWNAYSYGDFESTHIGGYSYYRHRRDDYLYWRYTSADGNNFMDDICTAAKDAGIVIFAIAMDAPTVGEQEMSKCASSPGHYFETSGDELVAIFEAIASQITDLRLTL